MVLLFASKADHDRTRPMYCDNRTAKTIVTATTADTERTRVTWSDLRGLLIKNGTDHAFGSAHPRPID